MRKIPSTIKEIAFGFGYIFGHPFSNLQQECSESELVRGLKLYLRNRIDFKAVAFAWNNGADYVAKDREHLSSLVKALANPAIPDEVRSKLIHDLNNPKQPPPKRAARSQKVGCIYLAVSGSHNLTKIGWSTTPAMREETLQGKDPLFKIVFSSAVAFTKDDEKRIHERFNSCRVRGEWFNLKPEDIDVIKEEIAA